MRSATGGLNPPKWVDWVDEPAPGYPRRPVPRDEDAAKELRKRTLTNPLQRPPPVARRRARGTRCRPVAAAHGWPADITDDDALRELLARNRGCEENGAAALVSLPAP